MAVNETGNQFVFPNKKDPTDPLNLEVLERWLNTQVVNRITDPSSSKPVLGLPGTGIVETGGGGGGITEVESDSPDRITASPTFGPDVHIEIIAGLWGLGAAFAASDGDPLSILFDPRGIQSVFLIGRVCALGDTDLGFQFNGDTGSNYAWQSITNTAGTLLAAVSASDVSINGMLGPDATGKGSCAFSGWIPEIGVPTLPFILPYVANLTVNWGTTSLGDVNPSGNGQLSGSWLNNGAVTRIDLISGTGAGFSAGSGFEVYGLTQVT